MKKFQILFIILFIFESTSLHVKMHHEANTLTAGTVNLKSDNGKYLGRCNGCGPGALPDSASIHVTDPTVPPATWKL